MKIRMHSDKLIHSKFVSINKKNKNEMWWFIHYFRIITNKTEKKALIFWGELSVFIRSENIEKLHFAQFKHQNSFKEFI